MTDSDPSAGTTPRKLGLALSGGGFRAAFFHLGVLARLAELGLLQQIHTLSTVSGGSMVGALYYVRIKELLEKPELPLTNDYVNLVEELISEFRTAVRRNLRARVFLNPAKNLDMLARTAYSRSDRIGDLLDRTFYQPAWDSVSRFGVGRSKKQIELHELLIEGPNDGRLRPRLVMNATSLNTGHSWRFEPIGMGEPPLTPGQSRIDGNDQLAWGEFDGPRKIASVQRDFPLGLAVAASGGFPGLVSPLSISGLYEGWRVRLMDGGANDNQGIGALTKCNRLIVSDGSKQMTDERNPLAGIPFLLVRANSIYGDRVREEQLLGHDWGKTHALVHLREGLRNTPVYPLDDSGTPVAPVAEYALDQPATPGIARRVQEVLASVRTDLDAFHDTEANALMLNGYLLARRQLVNSRLPGIPGLPAENALPGTVPTTWRFHTAAGPMATPSQAYLDRLDLSSKTLFKSLAILSLWQRLALLLVAAVAVGAHERWPVLHHFPHDVRWGWAALLSVAAAALGPVLARLFSLIPPFRPVKRKVSPQWRFRLGRWGPIVVYAAAAAALIGAAARYATTINEWVGVDWPGWALGLATAVAIVLPPILPSLLAIIWWLGGRVYLHRGDTQPT